MAKPKQKKERPFFYGGQAVIEGVMMRGRSSYCVSVRNAQGEIENRMGRVKSSKITAALGKVPILRGIVRLGASLMVGMKVMKDSAEISGQYEDETPTKFDIWLDKKLGDKATNYIMVFSVALSLAFSVALFMVLPTWLSGFLAPILAGNLWALGIIEGLVRLAIFMAYILLIARIKEIRRVFQYHGAEHKAINCHESGQNLTIDNVARMGRLHKRCGTSFLLLVMLISMVFFLFVRTDILWLRVLSRILFVPFIAGVSFEVISWAGNSKSPIVAIISFPGLMLQKITTAEPDEKQIEVAISALQNVVSIEEPKIENSKNLRSIMGQPDLRS